MEAESADANDANQSYLTPAPAHRHPRRRSLSIDEELLHNMRLWKSSPRHGGKGPSQEDNDTDFMKNFGTSQSNERFDDLFGRISLEDGKTPSNW
ncbi:hypothetical protein CLOM_g20105 [Closterium sp. NIES-68]|nr:hypothetical protein CLOM_g20105 [Closterium sp. NIES-68]GJP64145.1 hypothetical protein CLOP_g21164 [Closterium sp. NIES-67]